MGKRVFTIIIVIAMSINFLACKTKDKENILLNDVKSQSKVEQQEINTAIENGNKYLEEENYDKAKKWYEEAISISKNNADTYIKIKDKYLEKDRKDDAYRIVRLAIDNNVDVENMKKELKKIEDTFDTVVINKSIYVNENYQLPSEIILNVTGSDVNGKITWDNSKVTTSKSGKFIYRGNIFQYGRKVVVNLEVKDIEKKKLLCYVSDIYEEEGNIYISVDELQYFQEDTSKDNDFLKYKLRESGEELEQYIVFVDSETGKKNEYTSYRIKNVVKRKDKYNVSGECRYSYINQTFDDGVIYNRKNIKYKDLIDRIRIKNQAATRFGICNDGLPCWVYIENNVVVQVDELHENLLVLDYLVN